MCWLPVCQRTLSTMSWHLSQNRKVGSPEDVFLGKRLSMRVQVTGKVVGIEHDSIMTSVTILHADQFFETLIDTEELISLDLMIGDDVIVGVKSSDVILFKI